jgi:tRNA A37 threonylcarbamoyladenosine dehydratase
LLDDFVGPENVAELFAADAGVVIDCTDQAQAKIAMILESRARGIPIVVCGGAGGKTNPLSLRAADLSLAVNDALLAKLRNTLRRQHRFPKASGQAGKPRKRVPKMGVRTLWFDQPTLLPAQWQQPDAGGQASVAQDAPSALQGLSCAGYGSVVTVTAAMGMAAANEAVQWLLHGRFA